MKPQYASVDKSTTEESSECTKSHPEQCDEKAETYADRKARITSDIEGLMKALEIITAETGSDHIDLAAAAERKITILNNLMATLTEKTVKQNDHLDCSFGQFFDWHMVCISVCYDRGDANGDTFGQYDSMEVDDLLALFATGTGTNGGELIDTDDKVSFDEFPEATEAIIANTLARPFAEKLEATEANDEMISCTPDAEVLKAMENRRVNMFTWHNEAHSLIEQPPAAKCCKASQALEIHWITCNLPDLTTPILSLTEYESDLDAHDNADECLNNLMSRVIDSEAWLSRLVDADDADKAEMHMQDDDAEDAVAGMQQREMDTQKVSTGDTEAGSPDAALKDDAVIEKTLTAKDRRKQRRAHMSQGLS
jgi:hypothetical protein